MLEATARDQASAGRLERAWTGAREAEWAEFRAECARYFAELDKEVATGKLTAAEFEGDRIEVSELLSAPDRHGLQTHAKGYGPLARHDHRRHSARPERHLEVDHPQTPRGLQRPLHLWEGARLEALSRRSQPSGLTEGPAWH